MGVDCIMQLEDEEPFGIEELAPIVFDEPSIGLDDTDASELDIDVALDMGPSLSLVDMVDQGPLDGEVLYPALNESTARGSWLQSQPDEPAASNEPILLDAPPFGDGDDDAEGPEDGSIVLGAAPPLDCSEDDSDGPVTVELCETVALGGVPYAFSLAVPEPCAFVLVHERDAEVLVADRCDTLRTDDGMERGARRFDQPILSARADQTIAFAFGASHGKVSFDGGETFSDAPWLAHATAIAAVSGIVFAAVYDSAVDRCTIVRATVAEVRRVADLHVLFEGQIDDETGFFVRSLVVLDEKGSKLLVQLRSGSFALSVR
jgi:hypothetical protein